MVDKEYLRWLIAKTRPEHDSPIVVDPQDWARYLEEALDRIDELESEFVLVPDRSSDRVESLRQLNAAIKRDLKNLDDVLKKQKPPEGGST